MGFGNFDDDFGLKLDFGEDIVEGLRLDWSVEMGRDVFFVWFVEDDMFSEMDFDLGKDRNECVVFLEGFDFGDGVYIMDDEGDIVMLDDVMFNVGDVFVMFVVVGFDMSCVCILEFLLFDIDEEFVKEVEMEYSCYMIIDLYEFSDELIVIIVNVFQCQKKRKLF